MEEIDQYAVQAHQLVNDVIEHSLHRLTSINENSNNNEICSDIPNIKWLSIAEFSIELALKKIDEFIKVSVLFTKKTNCLCTVCYFYIAG